MRNYYTAILFNITLLLILLPLAAFSANKKPTADSPPKVIATIKPIHSLVAAVMGELGAPELLINGQASGHDYILKPSDMKKIHNTDIVFFTSMDLETFLLKTIASLPSGSVAVELAASEGVERQQPSEIISDHEHSSYDPHVWLSPVNAIAMVNQIKKILSLKDSKNRGIYEMNARNYINKISETSEKITLKLSPYKNIPFISFHDAYGYFVKSYGLNQVAAVSLNPEIALGAETISNLNRTIKKKHIYCIFADPEFPEASVKKLLNNPDQVKIKTLDPLGLNIEKGKGAYLDILNNISDNLLSCFGDS